MAELPTEFGNFQIYPYRHTLNNCNHVAIIKGNTSEFETQSVMVRMHSECFIGDALGSLRCYSRMQLQAALKMIEGAGQEIICPFIYY